MAQGNPDKSRLVYSTETGRACPECGKPVAQCVCRANKSVTVAAAGPVRVMRETKGRNGKGVTVVKGIALDAESLMQLGKQLRAACGTGGTVKEGAIELQGDHCDKVIAFLAKQNIAAKRAGG